ncbi:MAG: 1-(5-phosphoribosyl)-5-[(5-phosphoribosylamino)methylideneamino]imidazole-4-carboxamide isomerase [Pirellulales bacterium]|nr:1-(5-phosphoribosyl)-5-[(5-phosphoribosylamino)methylideneamino]imidazole-4-carboxamide isomerase [Pirellulales bacterium]
MQIWPAIDLRGGKCVRLVQGDYDRETVFGEDPAWMARQFVAQGGEHLHLVDLDGAREGRPKNLDSIRAIRAAVDIPIELGGGIRDEAAIRQLVELGINRCVIGTKAIKEPNWLRDMCRLFPGRIVLGIDARDGMVATDGWLETSGVRATDLARRLKDLPLAAIVFTDIATDGMLSGPNFDALAEMQAATRLPIVASGGVTTAEQVARLAELKLAGAIIGRALYEGAISLPDALAAARGATPSDPVSPRQG